MGAGFCSFLEPLPACKRGTPHREAGRLGDSVTVDLPLVGFEHCFNSLDALVCRCTRTGKMLSVNGGKVVITSGGFEVILKVDDQTLVAVLPSHSMCSFIDTLAFNKLGFLMEHLLLDKAPSATTNPFYGMLGTVMSGRSASTEQKASEYCMVSAHLRNIPSGCPEVVWMVKLKPSQGAGGGAAGTLPVEVFEVYSPTSQDLVKQLWRFLGTGNYSDFWEKQLQNNASFLTSEKMDRCIEGTGDNLFLYSIREREDMQFLTQLKYTHDKFGPYPVPRRLVVGPIVELSSTIVVGPVSIPACVYPVKLGDTGVCVFVDGDDTRGTESDPRDHGELPMSVVVGAVKKWHTGLQPYFFEPRKTTDTTMLWWKGLPGDLVNYDWQNVCVIIRCITIGAVGPDNLHCLKSFLGKRHPTGRPMWLQPYSSHIMANFGKTNWPEGLEAVLAAGDDTDPHSKVDVTVNNSRVVAGLAAAGALESLKKVFKTEVNPKGWGWAGGRFMRPGPDPSADPFCEYFEKNLHVLTSNPKLKDQVLELVKQQKELHPGRLPTPMYGSVARLVDKCPSSRKCAFCNAGFFVSSFLQEELEFWRSRVPLVESGSESAPAPAPAATQIQIAPASEPASAAALPPVSVSCRGTKRGLKGEDEDGEDEDSQPPARSRVRVSSPVETTGLDSSELH